MRKRNWLKPRNKKKRKKSSLEKLSHWSPRKPKKLKYKTFKIN